MIVWRLDCDKKGPGSRWRVVRKEGRKLHKGSWSQEEMELVWGKLVETSLIRRKWREAREGSIVCGSFPVSIKKVMPVCVFSCSSHLSVYPSSFSRHPSTIVFSSLVGSFVYVSQFIFSSLRLPRNNHNFHFICRRWTDNCILAITSLEAFLFQGTHILEYPVGPKYVTTHTPTVMMKVEALMFLFYSW